MFCEATTVHVRVCFLLLHLLLVVVVVVVLLSSQLISERDCCQRKQPCPDKGLKKTLTLTVQKIFSPRLLQVQRHSVRSMWRIALDDGDRLQVVFTGQTSTCCKLTRFLIRLLL